MSAEIPPAEEGPVAPEDRDRHDERLASFRGMIQSFGVLTLGETGARLLSFVAIIWMTRRLGVDRFGLVALGSNLVLWFGLIVNSSTQTIGLRDVARMPERFKAILEPLLGVRLAVSVVAMVLLAITSLVIGKSGS